MTTFLKKIEREEEEKIYAFNEFLETLDDESLLRYLECSWQTFQASIDDLKKEWANNLCVS